MTLRGLLCKFGPLPEMSPKLTVAWYSNQTNLAIKGIIGLRAMGEIAKLTNNQDQFSAIAQNYLEEWKKLAINWDAEFPHTTLSYGDKNSHGMSPTPGLSSTRGD
jgi:hypothetical protein